MVFGTHAQRAAAREAFFAKWRPCVRSSPLGKRYGWSIHSGEQERVALVPLGSAEYQRPAADPALKHTRAMRLRRAKG